jgi:threonine dehydrogenase-like Zn-dependent dehydrogenase
VRAARIPPCCGEAEEVTPISRPSIWGRGSGNEDGSIVPRMRAAFFEAARTITVREVPIPEPGPGEVRLKVRYCGICGSDLSVYKTGALAGPEVVLGHEIAAVVDLDPEGRWPQGTRVAPFPSRGCGECMWCREGHPRYCENPPYERWGGFAEFAVYPSENLIPIPENLDDRAAAAAEPFGVALRAVDLASPAPGDVAYVSGLGPIGLFSVAGLVAEGCRVIGADPRAERRELGLELGCEQAFDPTSEDPVSRTLSFDPHGPRIAFECSGAPESLQQIFDACGYQGAVGILGVPMAPVLLLRMFVKEQRAFSLSGPSRDSMERALRLLGERPHIARVITGTVPLEETDQAFRRLAAGDGGVKVLVAPEA